MKIYVAGASAEPKRCRAAMTAVQSIGFELTFDWLKVIEAEGSANCSTDDEALDYLWRMLESSRS